MNDYPRNFALDNAVPDDSQLIESILERLDLIAAPPEEDFDRFSRLVMMTLNAPVSLVAFACDSDDKLFLKSSVGLPKNIRETRLSTSLCDITHREKRVVVIEDATDQAHLCEFPSVKKHGVRAYIGAPIRHTDGRGMGTLCAMDRKRRKWTGRQVQIITDLAECVSERIALRNTRR